MQIEDYIAARLNKAADNGVTHLGPEFEKRFPDYSCITIDALVDWQQEVARKALEAESYSIEHGYYWSLDGHLTDIVVHAKLL